MQRFDFIRIVTCLTFLIVASSGCVSINLLDGGRGPLQETRISGPASAKNKILMLEVNGVIQDQGLPTGIFGYSSEGTVARIREELETAKEDSKIKALLVRVDSPGGSATASDLVFQEIKRFKEERNIPVVALFMGTAASGGYYVAMAADEIIALPTTVTGSIGVLFSGVSVAGLMEKLGIYDQTITSGEYKAANSPMRRMSPDQTAQLQTVIDSLYDRFIEVVGVGRPELEKERILELADGRIYSAPQALDAGLIDRIGSPEDAVQRAKARAQIGEAKVVTYHRAREFRQNLYTQAQGQPNVQIDVASLLGIRPAGPGFFYLWQPALR